MDKVGQFSVDIIVRRTRLGYGVDKELGPRSRLAGLSEKYIQKRKGIRLDATTRPARSNLTNTGQMLRSMGFKVLEPGKLLIEPEGSRDDGYTNIQIAEFNADRGRVFNNVSNNEFLQILRFYKRNFTDLLKKVRL